MNAINRRLWLRISSRKPCCFWATASLCWTPWWVWACEDELKLNSWQINPTLTDKKYDDKSLWSPTRLLVTVKLTTWTKFWYQSESLNLRLSLLSLQLIQGSLRYRSRSQPWKRKESRGNLPNLPPPRPKPWGGFGEMVKSGLGRQWTLKESRVWNPKPPTDI